jgi:microcystin-dependent protein
MSDQFLAEIRIFPFIFAPTGWAMCNGQLLPLSQNTALFSLLGTTYGGDGKTTFALPNMLDNAPMMWGQGPGLPLYDLGEQGGEPSVTLLQSEMPSHPHFMQAGTDDGDLKAPTSNRVLARSINGFLYQSDATGLKQMAPLAIGMNGGGLPHDNMMPSLTLNFCIALQGIYPARP